MSLLLESIRIENRQILLADEHSRRMNRSRRELFGVAESWDVRDLIAIPSDLPGAVHKCRVVYDTEIRLVEFLPYTPRAIRSLRLVEAPPELDYAYKYADRTAIDRLFAQRENCDDILIVRDGRITDTSFSNIAFYDGEHWHTPARPLLRGVRVASLLEQGMVREADIRIGDLPDFSKAILLNAMLGFGEAVEVEMKRIERSVDTDDTGVTDLH